MITSELSHSVNADFVDRLLVAHARHSHGIAAARRWRPGEVNGHVLELIGTTSHQHYSSFAMTAKLFAVWHRGRPLAVRGLPCHGIGQWLYQLGGRDPKTQRLLGRIINAHNDEELEVALTALAARRTRRAPHWETVLNELLRWSNPSERVAVQFDWANDFHRCRPNRSSATMRPKPRRIGGTL